MADTLSPGTQAQETPKWMDKKAQEMLQKIEGDKAKAQLKVSSKDQLSSLRHIRTNKTVWHTMPYFLLYLLSCSYADISSLDLVRACNDTSFGEITRIMKKIGSTVNIGIDLSRSCEIIRKDARTPYFRDFLQRFAQIAKMGEDMTEFLSKEYNTFMTMYSSEMERSLTRLKRFTEAYSAILSSSVLIVLILIFTSLIWGGSLSMVGTTIPLICVLYGVFCLVFYMGSPTVKLISAGPKEPKFERLLNLSKWIGRATIAINIAVGAILYLGLLPPDIVMIAAALAGAPALIVGWLGLRASNKVQAVDERFSEFVTMLATSLSSMGTSMAFAFRDIAKLDFAGLSPFIKRMSGRLELGIDKKLSWKTFQKETSSELVRIHSEAFSEANSHGAPAKEYGPLIANSALFVISLRRRMEETAALMKGIAVPMTPILCAIMGLIMGIISQFVNVFKTFQSQGLSFIFGFSSAESLPVLQSYIYIMILTLIIVNAFILHEVSGEQDFDMTYYLGMFTLFGWLAYYVCAVGISSYLQGIGLANLGNISMPGS